jgi:hypothetical protein
MPFIAIVHLRELQCPECGLPIAEAGARSFVVDTDGAPVWFGDADMPSEIAVDISCENGHLVRLLLPNEVGAEEAANVPEGAPFAPDAVLEQSFNESDKVL